MTSTVARQPQTQSPYLAFSSYFDSMTYPAGESHIAEALPTQRAEHLVIEMAVYDFAGLGKLLTADAILRRTGVTATWFVPYFPFSRHDRRHHVGDGFELGIALEMVRDLNIVIADPHSDVAGQLPHIPQTASVDCFRDAAVFPAGAVMIIPDAGATKKAHEWATGPTVQALKHRDAATGRLSNFEILSDDLGGAPCVIVDDICDGGGTFLGLATELRAKNAGPLTLAITHGLFTKGTDLLRGSFDRIVTFGFHGGERLPGVDYLPFHDLYNKGARR